MRYNITDEVGCCYGLVSAKADLQVIRKNTLTIERYADEILRSYVGFYTISIRDLLFLFMQDNARPYATYLEENMAEADCMAGHHALLTLIQLTMFEIHLNDALQ